MERMLSGAPEESKVFSEESVPAGRGRGLVQMLSGAVLLFLIGGVSSCGPAWYGFVVLGR